MAVKVRHKRESSTLVIWIVFGLMISGMIILTAELWQLQVQNKSGFDQVFRDQSVRRVRLPAVRGKIYDRNGVCLADSVPNYCIAIYTEELRAPRSAVANTLELIHEIWVRVGREPDISFRDVQQHFLLTPEQPLTAWKNLDEESFSRWTAALAEWTAPEKGSRRTKIEGLADPVSGGHRSIVLNTAELKKKSTTTAANTLELVYEISKRIGIPRAVTFQQIKDHIFARRPLPLMAWKNIDDRTMARWAESCSDLIGTDLYCQAGRHYPEGENFAHLIGYTGTADETRKEGEQDIHFDLRGLTGRNGLEKIYNALLEGRPGAQVVRIDVSGYRHNDLQKQEPQPGGDLQLTIDANIQRFAKEAIDLKQNGEGEGPVRGAVVVLDPNNGDVLAMVSSPSFDPNLYLRDQDYFRSIQQNSAIPTFHRAVFGQYPPGSTFKPVVALGALREHPEFEQTVYDCRNPYRVAKRRMKCWIHSRHGEHGKISLRQALMHSCNVYMFEMAQAAGYEPIHAMAREFGLGQFAGLFPDLEEPPQQKNLKYGNLPDQAVNTIDLCNMSIGQGAITASPLQMAMVAATIANGGRLYRPRLVGKWSSGPGEGYKVNPVWAIHQIDVPMKSLELVRGGMLDVVMHKDGTARSAQVADIPIAGKTGTAQYRKKVDDSVVNSAYTWMISYAPYDLPRYAVAMLVEDGVSGGSTIGPRLSYLYDRLFHYDGTLSDKEES